MSFNKFFVSALAAALACCTMSHGQETPWQNIGPYMGYINDMTLDQAFPDTLYAATPYGVYKTVDCAGTWTKTALSGVEIKAVEVSTADPDIVIACSDSVLYRSENGGGSWSQVWKSERDIGAIALDPDDPLGIWAGVDVPEYRVYEPNLYYSDDGGSQWSPVSFEEGEELKLATVLDIHFDRSNHSVMYVSGWNDTYHVDGGLFVSQDKGTTWQDFRLGGCSSNTVNCVATTPAGYEPHAAYALVGPDCGIDKEMHRSLDYGDTWEEVWTPFDADEQRFAGESMIIDHEDSNWLMVGGRDPRYDISVFLYNTVTDSWYAWTGTPHSYPTVILSHPDGNFLGFEKNGVYQAFYPGGDVEIWNRKNKGMNDVEILDLVPYPGDPGKLKAAAAGNLAQTEDGGTNWTVEASSYIRLAVDPQDTSTLFAGAKVTNHTFMSPFYAYKSENGGISWDSQQLFTNSGLMDYYYTLWVGDILMSPDEPGHVLIGVDGGGGCGEGLFRSVNGGDTWEKEYSTGISALAMDPSDHDVLYLGTSGLGYVARSENGGETWDMISPGSGDAFVSSVRALAVDKNQQVFAATSAGLYRWESGTTWSQVNGVPTENIPALVIDNRPASPVLYAGTGSSGIYVSENGGSSWETYNSGLGTLHITRLEMDDADPPNLYAGTLDGGVWVTQLEEVISGVPLRTPDKEALEVYPNPSNRVFHLRPAGTEGLKGTLRITNLLGEVVYADPDFRVAAGSSRSVELEPVSPGCYILLLETNKQTITRKILVEKR